MISRLILICRVNVPTARLFAIHTHEVPLPYIVRKVILRHIAPIRKLEGLILDLWSIGVKSKIWQLLIFVRVETICEAIRIEAPQGPEDRKIRKRFVDEVLVSACQVRVDDPVEVAKG